MSVGTWQKYKLAQLTSCRTTRAPPSENVPLRLHRAIQAQGGGGVGDEDKLGVHHQGAGKGNVGTPAVGDAPQLNVNEPDVGTATGADLQEGAPE